MKQSRSLHALSMPSSATGRTDFSSRACASRAASRFVAIRALVFGCVFALIAFFSSATPSMAATVSRETSTSTSASRTGFSPESDDLAESSATQTPGIKLSIKSADAVIGNDGTYTATVTIKNATGMELHAGSIQMFASTRSIIGVDALARWEQGYRAATTPVEAARADTPKIAAGKTADVHISVAANSPFLSSITTWGVKPITFVYEARTSSGTTSDARINTVVTRSHDGLPGAATPTLGIVPVLPLFMRQAAVNTKNISSLVSDSSSTSAASTSTSANPVTNSTAVSSNAGTSGAATSGTASSSSNAAKASPVLTQTKTSAQAVESAAAAAQKYPAVQIVAEPEIADSSYAGKAVKADAQKAAAVTQPYVFDIAARATNDALWGQAGLTDGLWSAAQAQKILAQSVDSAQTSSDQSNADQSASTQTSTPAIAWEGRYSWNYDSLSWAKSQGYSAVMAASADRTDGGSTVQSSRCERNTKNGTITVLLPQSQLSELAQGKELSPTADNAIAQSAEGTSAGRMARFAAQTAVYQMQQPYKNRTLLVNFGNAATAQQISSLMTTISSCDWLATQSLSSLIGGTGISNGIYTVTTKPITDKDAAAIGKELQSFIDAKSTAAAIRTDVLAHESASASQSKTSNPQALSRQDAKEQIANTLTPAAWENRISAARNALLLQAFGAPASTQSGKAATQAQKTALQAVSAFHSALLGAVSLSAPASINVFSQTAQMPVTITNALPFPVTVTVPAETNSNATTIAPKAGRTVTVPANSEAQATYTISTVGASAVTARFHLLSQTGTQFGSVAKTRIYTQLSLNETSGNIIIIIAVALGILGLWRQFHVKKDADQ